MTTRLVFTLALMLAVAGLWAKGEYKSTYLYTEPDAGDPGGITLTLSPDSPKPDLAAAIGRGKGGVYRARVSADGRTLTWEHLPIDIYDVVVIAGKHFWEGIRLTRRPDPQLLESEKAAVEDEVRGVEGFFDGKVIHRMEVDGQGAVVLLQQHRIGIALAESGAVLEGTVHSLDLIWFEKPLAGWQLVRRRQLYREELPFKEPMTHHHVARLGKIRVMKSTCEVGPVQLTTGE